LPDAGLTHVRPIGVAKDGTKYVVPSAACSAIGAKADRYVPGMVRHPNPGLEDPERFHPKSRDEAVSRQLGCLCAIAHNTLAGRISLKSRGWGLMRSIRSLAPGRAAALRLARLGGFGSASGSEDGT
jgi:hypothetical protein